MKRLADLDLRGCFVDDGVAAPASTSQAGEALDPRIDAGCFVAGVADVVSASIPFVSIDETPAAAPGDDSDGDGYSDGDEAALGKDPNAYCHAMRADVNHDRVVNLLDLSAVSGAMGKTTPGRYDQNADGRINLLDMSLIAARAGQSVSLCQNAPPASGGGGGGSASFAYTSLEQQLLDKHNAARAAVGVGPLVLEPKESLALMNGTSVMTALACLAIDRAARLARWACTLTAMSVRAVSGNPQHYSRAIFELKPHPGTRRAAAWIAEDLEPID